LRGSACDSAKEEIADISGVEGGLIREVESVGDENRAMLGRRGRCAVGASDESGIERDDIHEHAETELLLQQPPGDLEFRETEFRVEEQFHWVVTRLAMDIDSAGEVGSAMIVEPIVVGKPAL
jgi:hypothetical protein